MKRLGRLHPRLARRPSAYDYRKNVHLDAEMDIKRILTKAGFKVKLLKSETFKSTLSVKGSPEKVITVLLDALHGLSDTDPESGRSYHIMSLYGESVSVQPGSTPSTALVTIG